ncbi:MAG: M42 family metallopeptidase [Acetivibrionales bacterium]
MDYKNILTELAGKTAVSGRESTISEYLRERFIKHCDSVEADKFYNIIGIKNGNGKERKKILITAHVDEIGLMVKSIDEKGFIKFTNIGGVDSRILLAQEVIIHGKEDIIGIIGAKPPHLLSPEDAKKAVKIEELSIDTGMPEEKLKKIVSIGDMITFKECSLELNKNKLSSKSMDNRCGVAALLGVMGELSKINISHDLYFVCTTQEEVRLAGATIVTYNIKPDIAIVIDACHGDMPDASKDETYKLGKGPAIGVGPNLHKAYTRTAIDIAKDENIPFQIDVEPGNTGTEAWAIQVSRAGVPVVLFSIPVRYMHTPVETVHLDDIKRTAKLTARFVLNMEASFKH